MKKIDRSILEGESIALFRTAIRSKYTLDPYERRLLSFLKSVNKTCDEFVGVAKKNPAEVEKCIIKFMMEEKARVESRELSASSIRNKLKPIRLLLEMSDVVLDPFTGSGTTAVVAKRLGRRFVGCDINPEYVKIAMKRLEVVYN